MLKSYNRLGLGLVNLRFAKIFYGVFRKFDYLIILYIVFYFLPFFLKLLINMDLIDI